MKHIIGILLLGHSLGVGAQQPLCSSDGRSVPRAVVERFISADCAACWHEADAEPLPPTGTVVLDWVVPGANGASAPLAAGARRDALERLQMLGRPKPTHSLRLAQPMQLQAQLHLRVAHGLPVANYVGTAVELGPPEAGPWTAVLLLVERMRTDASGKAPERHLVRNMLVTDWSEPRRSVDEALALWRESRPMSIPEDTLFEKLYALAWVENAQGHVVALARADCT